MCGIAFICSLLSTLNSWSHIKKKKIETILKELLDHGLTLTEVAALFPVDAA